MENIKKKWDTHHGRTFKVQFLYLKGKGKNIKSSSKDAGGKITSIIEDRDRRKYDGIIKDLLKNPELILKWFRANKKKRGN